MRVPCWPAVPSCSPEVALSRRSSPTLMSRQPALPPPDSKPRRATRASTSFLCSRAKRLHGATVCSTNTTGSATSRRPRPCTPSEAAVKYIRYQGIWDLNELYDLKEDPLETHNLINSPKHVAIAKQMSDKMFDILESTDGMSMPLYRDRGGVNGKRNPDGSKAAEYPDSFLQKPKSGNQP